MSDPEKKDLEVSDSIAAAVEPTNEDRRTHPDSLREDINEKDSEKIAHLKGSDEGEDDEEENGAELQVTRTSLSATTTATRTTTATPAAHPKAWHHKINPLKWGKPAEVPDERRISREYTAGFFSLLTFQWMAPLMTVSFVQLFCGSRRLQRLRRPPPRA